MVNSAVREDIIEAFKELYAKNGMLGISAGTVADRAGYSRSTLYRQFDSMYDILRILEDEAIPFKEFLWLIEKGGEIGIETFRHMILEALCSRKEAIALMVRFERDNSFYSRMSELLRSVFRVQIERVYVLSKQECEILTGYITSAKMSLLKYWALSDEPLELSHLTNITDSMFEMGLWNKVEEVYQAQQKGIEYVRESLPPESLWD